MGTKGYDLYITDVDLVEGMECKICGAECEVKRSVYGPTSAMTAMVDEYSYHDEFECPHSREKWHQKVVELVQEMQFTASKRVRELIKRDLEELLKKKEN